MVGMGKAMAEWLEVVRSGDGSGDDMALAYSGLNRVCGSLLGAAGCDVEELVRDWTWNEGLDTHKSKSANETPIGSPRRRPQTDAGPIPSSLLPRRTDSAGAAATQKPLPDTPPARDPSPERTGIEEGTGAMGLSETRARSPAPAAVPPATSSVKIAPGAPGHQPTLQLSTRNDTPIPTISRVPVPAAQPPAAAQLSPRTAVHTSPSMATTVAPTQEQQPVSPTHTPSPVTHSPSPPLDPLGGLGVSESATVERRRSGIRMRPTSSSSGFSSATTDPLGAS